MISPPVWLHRREMLYSAIIKKYKHMTVQELINELQKVENKNLKVVVRGSDPTDYTYYNDVESVERDKVYYEEENTYRYRFIIDGGMF
jgi:hypothetical protein